MKLFKVELKSTGFCKIHYVIAKDASEAYKKVRKFMNENELGFEKERSLVSTTLLAETGLYRGRFPLHV